MNLLSYQINDRVVLKIIQIASFSRELRSEVDAAIRSICEGASDSDITDVKKRYFNYLSTKDYNKKIGSIAEFFVHLFLIKDDFRQEFLFFNLEEGSIKKGFDGLFTKNSELFIVESKSGSGNTKDISHKVKLKEAYDGICSYMACEAKNNPWRNAYNHASHADVGSKKTLRDRLKKLSDFYDKKTVQTTADFNLIPCSTIFLDGSEIIDFSDDIKSDTAFLNGFDGKTVRAVCITKSTFYDFMNYLDE